MTVRTESADSNPLRVVIDSNNIIITIYLTNLNNIITDKSLNIFSSDAETLILNNNNSEMLANGKLDLKSALIKLGEMGINNLLLEAGSGLNGAMTEAGLIDEFIIYTAPLILGSDANPMIEIPLKKMSDKIKLNIIEVSQIDCDIKIRATIK